MYVQLATSSNLSSQTSRTYSSEHNDHRLRDVCNEEEPVPCLVFPLFFLCFSRDKNNHPSRHDILFGEGGNRGKLAQTEIAHAWSEPKPVGTLSRRTWRVNNMVSNVPSTPSAAPIPPFLLNAYGKDQEENEGCRTMLLTALVGDLGSSQVFPQPGGIPLPPRLRMHAWETWNLAEVFREAEAWHVLPGFVTDSFWWRVTRSAACVTNLPGQRFRVQRRSDKGQAGGGQTCQPHRNTWIGEMAPAYSISSRYHIARGNQGVSGSPGNSDAQTSENTCSQFCCL